MLSRTTRLLALLLGAVFPLTSLAGGFFSPPFTVPPGTSQPTVISQLSGFGNDITIVLYVSKGLPVHEAPGAGNFQTYTFQLTLLSPQRVRYQILGPRQHIVFTQEFTFYKNLEQQEHILQLEGIPLRLKFWYTIPIPPP